MHTAQATNRTFNQVRLMVQQWQGCNGESGSALYDAYRESVLGLLRLAFRKLYLELGSSCAGYQIDASSLNDTILQLQAREIISPELTELSNMLAEPSCWLTSMLREQLPIEDSSAPMAIVQVGGVDDQQCLRWLAEMHDLANHLRSASEQW